MAATGTARTSTDLLVVGAGPCGLAVGVAARRAGIDCVIVERGAVVNTIAGYPLGMTFFSTADRLELGGLPFVIDHARPTRSEALAYYRRVCDHFELDVRQNEEVIRVRRDGVAFRVASRGRSGDEQIYEANAVVVATGYFGDPVPLGAPGEDLPKVTHYFRDPHLGYDQEVLVVGGGNSAVEAALESHRAGARVTMVHLFGRFDSGVKPWILPDLESLIRDGRVRIFWKHRVVAITPDTVVLRDLESEEETRLENDLVLAMTGYRPALDLLESFGLPVDPDSGTVAHDPGTLETEEPGLFIAGVVAAGVDANRLFIENGRLHGEAIVAGLQNR